MSVSSVVSENVSRIRGWRSEGVSWSTITDTFSSETGNAIGEGSLKAAFSRIAKSDTPPVQMEKPKRARAAKPAAVPTRVDDTDDTLEVSETSFADDDTPPEDDFGEAAGGGETVAIDFSDDDDDGDFAFGPPLTPVADRYAEGYSAGIEKGRAEGLADGFEKGREVGKREIRDYVVGEANKQLKAHYDKSKASMDAALEKLSEAQKDTEIASADAASATSRADLTEASASRFRRASAALAIIAAASVSWIGWSSWTTFEHPQTTVAAPASQTSVIAAPPIPPPSLPAPPSAIQRPPSAPPVAASPSAPPPKPVQKGALNLEDLM